MSGHGEIGMGGAIGQETPRKAAIQGQTARDMILTSSKGLGDALATASRCAMFQVIAGRGAVLIRLSARGQCFWVYCFFVLGSPASDGEDRHTRRPGTWHADSTVGGELHAIDHLCVEVLEPLPTSSQLSWACSRASADELGGMTLGPLIRLFSVAGGSILVRPRVAGSSGGS